MNSNRISERLYLRHQHLAKKYAKTIYSFEELSFEYEDLVQEFSLKIYLSILSYGKRWKRYKEEGYAKPVPLRYYLEAACANKARDFMKYISRENHKVRMDDIDYDMGIDMDTEISPERNRFIVNGIDLLENLKGKDRAVFSLYLRGFGDRFLTKVYNQNKEIVERENPYLDLIEKQKAYLITNYGSDLLRSRQTYTSFHIED